MSNSLDHSSPEGNCKVSRVSAKFTSNEFFFSLDQYEEILNICLEFLGLLNKAIEVVRDLSLLEKERAIMCFDIFAEFKMAKYRDARKRLIDTFRHTLNVPLLSK